MDVDGQDAAPGVEICDVDAWETLSKSIEEVQSVLDRNRLLIQQVNANHRSKIPQKLAENVNLIREINANMSRIVATYSNLSSNLTNIVHQRRASTSASASANVAPPPVNKK